MQDGKTDNYESSDGGLFGNVNDEDGSVELYDLQGGIPILIDAK